MRHYQAIKGRSKFMAYVSLLFVTIAFSFGTFGLLEKEALAADPIIIGCPLAMGFPQGVGAKQGFDLAVMEINKQGGVKVGNERRPIKIVVMDTRDLAAGVPVSESLLAVERLILGKKADFLLGGPIRSEAALAVMDLIAQHKKINIITAGAITPGYTKKIAADYDKYKYLFRLSANAISFVGETLQFFASLRKQYGYNNVAFMIQDVMHARQMAKFVQGGLTKMGGWEMSKPLIYPTGSMDYSTGLLKVKRQKAQIAFVWMDHPEVSILIKQAYDFKVPALLAGKQGGLQDPGFWKATEGKCQAAISTELKASSLPSPALSGSKEYFDAHVKMYGKGPIDEWAGISYISVYVLAEAIERAGTIDTDAVLKELEKTDRPSIIGRIRFDPKSHQVIEKLDPAEGVISMWSQWQDGKRVPVFPPKIGSKVIPSPWMK
jgi:branched-chain amino acid transport system substrate-binding protein